MSTDIALHLNTEMQSDASKSSADGKKTSTADDTDGGVTQGVALTTKQLANMMKLGNDTDNTSSDNDDELSDNGGNTSKLGFIPSI